MAVFMLDTAVAVIMPARYAIDAESTYCRTMTGRTGAPDALPCPALAGRALDGL